LLQLAHLWPEVFPIVLNFTLGMPLGLQPLQVSAFIFVGKFSLI
jgi:hypothetical protein